MGDESMILPAKAKAYLEEHLVICDYCCSCYNTYVLMVGYDHGAMGTTWFVIILYSIIKYKTNVAC